MATSLGGVARTVHGPRRPVDGAVRLIPGGHARRRLQGVAGAATLPAAVVDPMTQMIE